MKPRCFSVFIMLISSMLLIGTVTAKTSIADNLDSPRLLQATAATTIRVSVASDGTQANNKSWGSTISSNGQYIAFYSDANNLVSGDSNSSSDIFVYSWQTGQTTRVSVASNGAQGNGHSYSPAISGDGRYIAFESEASNLVTGDTNGQRDIFVHDQQTGQTTRVSVASDGTQGDSWAYTASISADGRYVAFGSFSALFVSGDTNNQPDIFVHDRQTGTTTRISVASDGTEGNGRSDRAIVSSDGRYITFDSEATNLVSGDTNGNVDVFIHDRQTGETNRVSVGPGGVQGDQGSSSHSLSADGRYVVFGSSATNMVNGDTNNQQDIFVHDRQTGNTSRVSVASDGAEGNNSSSLAAASSDGRYIVFDSLASNLIPDDTNGVWDTFVHDQQTGETIRISIASGGLEGNGRTIGGSISADGHYIAFDSEASNLVPNDTNGSYDVFLHDREGILLPAPITDLQASTGSGQGQIELVWTAPQNINSNMNYQIRYASSPIASELGWTSAMAVMDVPVPADAGTVQNMTVTNLTPAQTYYFAIRVEYEPDNLSALSNSPGAAAANAPDLLFRPNPDGYQFVNPGYMQPTCSDFQRSYSGLSIQCTNNQPQQEYQALFKDYRSTFSTGICTGMAVSSLLYYTGAEPHPQP
ncbi:MAG: PD40 domain-containing protein, partial [Anaerolineales bacterium]|nr:PD40 domain-containing protein [Anaerolineales bacterium]